MGSISIFLILSFLLFFILTRCVWIYVIKDDDFKIELHLPIYALILDINGNGEKEKSKSTSKKNTLKAIRLITNRLRMCYVRIKSISLPKKEYEGTSGFTRPYTYTAILYALCALVESKSRGIIIEDRAIDFSDTKKIKCNITVYTRLYYFIISAFTIYLNLKRENKKEVLYDR